MSTCADSDRARGLALGGQAPPAVDARRSQPSSSGTALASCSSTAPKRVGSTSGGSATGPRARARARCRAAGARSGPVEQGVEVAAAGGVRHHQQAPLRDLLDAAARVPRAPGSPVRSRSKRPADRRDRARGVGVGARRRSRARGRAGDRSPSSRAPTARRAWMRSSWARRVTQAPMRPLVSAWTSSAAIQPARQAPGRRLSAVAFARAGRAQSDRPR